MILHLAEQLLGGGLMSINACGEDHASVHFKGVPYGSSQGGAIIHAEVMTPLMLKTIQVWEDGEPKRIQPPDSGSGGRWQS